jgi:hypothetical protein
MLQNDLTSGTDHCNDPVVYSGVYPNASIPIGNFTAATLAEGLNITIDKM